MQPKLSAILVTTLIMLLAPEVHAYTGVLQSAGFSDGFMHPVTGPDHMLVAIAAGYWAARSGDHGVPDMLYFLAMLAAGMLLGIVFQAWPQLDIIMPLLIVLVMAVIVVAFVWMQYFAYVLYGSVALWQGLVHMLLMPVSARAVEFCVGLLISTGLMLMLGLILRQVIVTRRPYRG